MKLLRDRRGWGRRPRGSFQRRILQAGAWRGCVALLGWLPALALGAELRVQVVDGDAGGPIEGASVCVGTPADAVQLGVQRTGANGSAAFGDIPRAPLILTIVRSGYKPERQNLEATTHDRAVTVPLARGGGPDYGCQAPVRRDAGNLAIRAFRINSGATMTNQRRVTLDFTVTGSPTEFRVSESRDFANADWQPMNATRSFELSPGAGTKRVFVQTRKFREVRGARLETLSDVVSDTIELK